MFSIRDCTGTETVVVGVDVGGERKGFHAVAFRGGRYQEQFCSVDPASVAGWCRDLGAQFVGVDAPCRWSMTGRARPAERALMKRGVWCFSTPTQAAAVAHPKKHFDWMLNGARLYKALALTHRLFDGQDLSQKEFICFETFPQAIACALAGEVISAKRKATVRRSLLERAGFDTSPLRNVDMIDAALCALMAHHVVEGNFTAYGESATGYIIVPECF